MKHEKDLQDLVDGFLDRLGHEYIRIPSTMFNAIYAMGKSVPASVTSEISNRVGGLPDNIITAGIMGTPFFLGMALELKSDSGKMSKKQLRWKRILNTTEIKRIEEVRDLVKKFDNALDNLNKMHKK